jgi:hypothetical protein
MLECWIRFVFWHAPQELPDHVVEILPDVARKGRAEVALLEEAIRFARHSMTTTTSPWPTSAVATRRATFLVG